MRLVNIERDGESPVYVDVEQVEAVLCSREIKMEEAEGALHGVWVGSESAAVLASGHIYFSRRPVGEVAEIIGLEAKA